MTQDDTNRSVWRSKAAAVAWDIRPFVEGRRLDSVSRETFAICNPATSAILSQAPVGDGQDIDRAVTSARRAFEDRRWTGLGVMSRKAILGAFIEAAAASADELALLDCLEMGKPIVQAQQDAGLLAPMFGRFCVESVDRLFGVVANTEPEVLAYSIPEPRGVIGAIVPWNFPLVNAMIKIAPALAAGNTVVLKPSELASASAVRLAELAIEAGLPPGVFNVVPGLGRTVGAALAAHGDIDMLSFTGSTATGRLLMRAAGESNGKALLLECGGKSPTVVFDDIADIEAVARQICGEALFNQGQVCVSRSRVIVQDTVSTRLVEALAAVARDIAPGDPLDPETSFGSLASRGQWLRARDLILAGVSQGARPAAGDLGALSAPDGAQMAPFVFTDLGRDNALWREEVFGPVIAVQSFSTPDEAMTMANDTDYGLAATVWTGDLNLAHAMARGLRAGEVTIRSTAAEYEGPGFVLPQEGRKASGFGSETGIEGLRSYTAWKKVEFHSAGLA